MQIKTILETTSGRGGDNGGGGGGSGGEHSMNEQKIRENKNFFSQ